MILAWRMLGKPSLRMDMLNMATARLRKTFQYPADNSDEDDTPRDLDEEGSEFPLNAWGNLLLNVPRTRETYKEASGGR